MTRAAVSVMRREHTWNYLVAAEPVGNSPKRDTVSDGQLVEPRSALSCFPDFHERVQFG